MEPIRVVERKDTTVWVFGEARVWLNPGNINCKAAIIWTVSIVRYAIEEPECYLDSSITGTDDEPWHSVGRKGELRPIQRAIRELQRYERTVKAALAWAKANNIELRD